MAMHPYTEVFMRVSFFVTCFADQFGSNAAEASVRLLRKVWLPRSVSQRIKPVVDNPPTMRATSMTLEHSPSIT